MNIKFDGRNNQTIYGWAIFHDFVFFFLEIKFAHKAENLNSILKQRENY